MDAGPAYLPDGPVEVCGRAGRGGNAMVELESFSPFPALSEGGKKLLRQGLVSKDCAPNASVLHKGQRISGAYFVVRGRLRVFSLAPNGTEATLYFIDPGETCVFALNSLFNDLLYPAWVQAEPATTVALIPGPIFRELFQREPAVQDVTVRALSTLVFRLMGELEQVHAYKLDQRLANLLLLHASAEGELPMTQRQMAHHLGTTREVVARLMRELVASGQVETRRGLTLIRDAAGLAGRIGQV
jgi:CRP/FNR family transcriptional regulator